MSKKSAKEYYEKKSSTLEGRRYLRKITGVLQKKFRRLCKIETLSHYGKRGRLSCCWVGCNINDIDMLTLDHVRNNGAKHRKGGAKTGTNLYSVLRQKGYPPGYQTLCANHQLKKEILRLRERKYASKKTD